jgi:hypothetical protein
MGEHADASNDEQAQSLEELLEYESGGMSDIEAIEQGILDEDGSIPTNGTTWGVHDVESLVAELDKCDAALLASERRLARQRKQAWVSNGKAYKPSEMTTPHLENAIAYAERKGIKGPIVRALEIELGLRKLSKQSYRRR